LIPVNQLLVQDQCPQWRSGAFFRRQQSEGDCAMTGSNVGQSDRLIRIVGGMVLIALVFIGPKTFFGWIGIVPLITGLVGWCPAYRIFGISSCKRH
jgi:hypothetical protein